MSKYLFYKVSIDGVDNTNCTKEEENALLDKFEYIVKRLSITPVRKASFVVGDFKTAKYHGIKKFTLEMNRSMIEGQHVWEGIFENRNKKLEVLGILEK